MPYFEENPLEKLVFQAGDADNELDLRDMPPDQAMALVEDLLNQRTEANSYLILFKAADNDGQETLFLPLGRRLLQARRDGVLSRCLPVADGTGYFIAFADAV